MALGQSSATGTARRAAYRPTDRSINSAVLEQCELAACVGVCVRLRFTGYRTGLTGLAGCEAYFPGIRANAQQRLVAGQPEHRIHHRDPISRCRAQMLAQRLTAPPALGYRPSRAVGDGAQPAQPDIGFCHVGPEVFSELILCIVADERDGVAPGQKCLMFVRG